MLDVRIDHLHKEIVRKMNIEKHVHPVPKLFDCIQYDRRFVMDIDMDELLNIFSNDISMLHKNHKSHPQQNIDSQ